MLTILPIGYILNIGGQAILNRSSQRKGRKRKIMRKNYSNGARTVIEGYSSDEYVALKDVQIDKKNKLFVKGIFSHISKYGDSYALVVEEEKDLHVFNINIPAWLGKNLKTDLENFMADYEKPNEALEYYFKGYYISEIVPIETRNGKSFDIVFDN